MLIEICEDIIKRAEDGNDDALNLLRLLAMANRQGKHIVTSSKELIRRIISIGQLDRQTKSIFRYLLDNNYILWSGVSNKISFKTKLTYCEHSRRDTVNNCVWLNPSEYELFNYLEATRLLCENLSDCAFYEYVIDYYRKKSGLSKARFRLSKMMGGGGTIDTVYEEASLSYEYFCVAIMDSDKYYPTSPIGETANGVMQVDARLGTFNTCYYVMENVSEVENLIPHNAIDACKGVQKYPNFDTSFWDMKNGLHCFPLRKYSDKYEYWKGVLGENAIQKAKQCQLSYNHCKKSCEQSSIVPPLYGAKILDTVLTEAVAELKNPQLTSTQITEWLAIGKLLFEWSCAMNRINV